MGGNLNEQEWGTQVEHYATKKLPLVLHFRPQAIVQVKKEKLNEYRAFVLQNLGLKVPAATIAAPGSLFGDDDGPFGPQPTISGSGDGWDDCD